MFSPLFRYVSLAIVGVATLVLMLGVVLFQAASATGADSDYTVTVSWLSVLSSVLWPPSRIPFLLLLGVLVLAVFTILVFFRAPRWLGVAVLFLQAVIGYFVGGWLGWFFLRREFAHYHFSVDGEKLGEHWFVYESIAVWVLAAAILGFLRFFARKQLPETQSHEQT